jgi:hypothetical protein
MPAEAKEIRTDLEASSSTESHHDSPTERKKPANASSPTTCSIRPRKASADRKLRSRRYSGARLLSRRERLLFSRRLARRISVALLAVLIFAIALGQRLSAQLQVSQLHGRVIDSQAVPMAGATVSLLDPAGNAIRRTTSEADGSFRIADVAPGSYVVRVELAGLVVLTRTLVVRGSLPVELTLQTGPTVAESIVVRGDAGSNTTERPLAGDVVREVGEPLPSQRVQAALAGLPGWMSEDNGLLHVRGVDDGLLYVQDGIPVYARLDRLFGMPPNPSAIASLDVLNGYIRRSTQSRTGRGRTGSTSANNTDAARGIMAARALGTHRLANVLLPQTEFRGAELVSR